ncbi:MAG TPA: CHASE3 domain-containing protein [Acidobacteriaceae bacterium]|jgi:PAS domain S-box-containing protein|nr:CHASE3 domain-containing protein [Acidobacteriaceae bacterium]
MKPLAFNRTLRQLVAVPILLLLILATFLLWQIQAAGRAQRELDHSDRITDQLQELQNHFIDQETGLRGFQLTGDPAMLAPWRAAAGPIQSRFGDLQQRLAGDPAQTARLTRLRSQYSQWLGFADAVVHQNAASLNAAGMNQRGKALMDAIRATLGAMQVHEANLREEQYRHARWLQRRELLSLLFSFLIVGAILVLFTRHHVRAISASYLRRIAELTRRSEELHDSQQWFQTTLESIGDAVIACDMDGLVTFMNVVAEKLTGWTLDDARGNSLESVFRIIHEETRVPAENPVSKVRRLRSVIGLANHTVLIARDGHESAIDDSAAPITSSAGTMIGVVLVFRDVTEERHMQSALVASEKLAVAGRLAASIAHEIHNPLDSVANLHYLLEQETDPAQRAEYLRLAQQELGRTMQISRTMLSLYREPKAPIRIRLRELIDGVLLLLDRRLQHQGIRVETDITDSLTVEGFPAELRQVLTNLVVNAMDASGPKGRIRIRVQPAEAAELRGAGALIEIADSGPGISPEAVSRLFQPFVTTKGANGTGLGLWVSMGIVQKHGGSIHIRQSDDPELPGACVRVFLPTRTFAGETGLSAAEPVAQP